MLDTVDGQQGQEKDRNSEKKFYDFSRFWSLKLTSI